MIAIKGKGLIIGLNVTIKKFFRKKITEEYPEVMPKLPARSHGSFAFEAEKCIVCGLCSNACPNRVIDIQSFKDEAGKKVLENYKMNLAYCMFCGLCVQACPTKAIGFKPDFELACYHREGAISNWKGCSKDETAASGNDILKG